MRASFVRRICSTTYVAASTIHEPCLRFAPLFCFFNEKSCLSLSSRDSPPDPRAALPRVDAHFLSRHRLRALLDHLLAFREDQLDVAGIRHVWVDLSTCQSEISLTMAATMYPRRLR